MLHITCERGSLLNFLFSRQALTEKANLPPLDGRAWIQLSAPPLGMEAFEDSAQRLNQQVRAHIGAKEFPFTWPRLSSRPADQWRLRPQRVSAGDLLLTQLLPGRLPMETQRSQVNPVKLAVRVTSSYLQYQQKAPPSECQLNIDERLHQNGSGRHRWEFNCDHSRVALPLT